MPEPVPARNGKKNAGYHEYDRRPRGQLAHEGTPPRAAEKGLGGTSECRPHFRAFARLEQNDDDKREANDYVNQYDQCSKQLWILFRLNGELNEAFERADFQAGASDQSPVNILLGQERIDIRRLNRSTI